MITEVDFTLIIIQTNMRLHFRSSYFFVFLLQILKKSSNPGYKYLARVVQTSEHLYYLSCSYATWWPLTSYSEIPQKSNHAIKVRTKNKSKLPVASVSPAFIEKQSASRKR